MGRSAVKPYGIGDVPKLTEAAILEIDSVSCFPCRRPSPGGDQHLARIGQADDSGSRVDGGPEPVTTTGHSGPVIKPDPHERETSLGTDLTSDAHRKPHGFDRIRNADEGTISHRVDVGRTVAAVELADPIAEA